MLVKRFLSHHRERILLSDLTMCQESGDKWKVLKYNYEVGSTGIQEFLLCKVRERHKGGAEFL